MSRFFEELDYQETPIGPISLRRRHDFRLKIDILEIMLGEEHLMSDLFTASEIALAELGLAFCRECQADETTNKKDAHIDGALQSGKTPRNVLVGGLGLGYTADAVLQDAEVEQLVVVDALQQIIDWHQTGLLPLGKTLCADPRCQFICTDFFAAAASDIGFDASQPQRLFDAILVDIDHAPDFHLAPGNESFYAATGLTKLQDHLTPHGIFGLWSNDPPDAAFTAHLQSVFADARAEPVVFANPFQDADVTQTIYLARR